MPNEMTIAPIMYGLRRNPRVRIEHLLLRALYALKSWMTTSVANAIVVDLM